MAFREKITWISALSTAAVYGWYFWIVWPFLLEGRYGALHFGRFLQLTIFALVALQVLLIGIAAMFSRRDATASEDEREKLITLKGTRVAYFLLVTGALLICVYGIFFHADSVVLGNAALMAVVVSNVVKDATQIVHYRMGA